MSIFFQNQLKNQTEVNHVDYRVIVKATCIAFHFFHFTMDTFYNRRTKIIAQIVFLFQTCIVKSIITFKDYVSIIHSTSRCKQYLYLFFFKKKK